MRARDIIGRKIVRVDQELRTLRLLFDDGSQMWFSVAEQENAADYIVVGHSSKESERPCRRCKGTGQVSYANGPPGSERGIQKCPRCSS